VAFFVPLINYIECVGEGLAVAHTLWLLVWYVFGYGAVDVDEEIADFGGE
jgi:hypothetical protein